MKSNQRDKENIEDTYHFECISDSYYHMSSITRQALDVWALTKEASTKWDLIGCMGVKVSDKITVHFFICYKYSFIL